MSENPPYNDATEKDLCKLALAVQNASNLPGVIYTFHQVSIRIRDLGLNERTHPAMVLFLDKILDLMNPQAENLLGVRLEMFGPAYQTCRTLAEGT